jgi:protocatechuate 3,4-dioxygenase beta subunit
MTDGAGNYVADSMTGKGMYRAQVFATAEASAPLLPAEGGHPQIRLDDGASRVEGVRLRVRNERRAIAGRVIDGAGAPIPDARVVALATRPGAEPVFTPWIAMPSARSDEDGAFSIADLAPGTYAVRAFAPGGSDGTVRDVHAGTSGVFVTIARAGSIRGRLVGFAAPPEVVVSALEAANKFVPAEVDGASFGVDGLSPGRYLVVAQMPGEGAAEVVDVRAGTPAELTLESKGAATIEATVTDFESGAPLPGFRCGTSARDGAHVPPPTWDPRGALVTDAQGRFVDARAPAGDFQVTCLGAGAYTTGLAVGSVPRGGRQAVRLKVLRRADGWKLTTTGILLDFQQAEPRVARVEPQSPAARADVRPGDLLHSVDGASLEGLGPEGVAVLLGRRAAGTQVTVALARAGQALTVTLPVVERE